MCTLSFLPEQTGYLVGMNRDELKSRGPATGPAIHHVGHVNAIYPQEENGGTWFAANSQGNLLAILNWNDVGSVELTPKLKSRGELIPAVLEEETPEKAEKGLLSRELYGMHPFRLVGIFPGQKEIRQWNWDGTRLSSRWLEWVRTHWFSSSRSDVLAEQKRRRVCESSWREGIGDRVAWLRDLHASHLPEAGAFSVCVHRLDASTVSYAEVQCGRGEMQMTYMSGHPCSPNGDPSAITISRFENHG